MTNEQFDMKQDLMCRMANLYLRMFHDWKNISKIPDPAVRKYVTKILDKRMRDVLHEMQKIEANEQIMVDFDEIFEPEEEDTWIEILSTEDYDN